ncbi:MAG: 4-phosphoerythronate dehydrogenase [Tannerella sp.]|nr:4-phosphoerythronate dehydrogenase [Tannerella sp.]
MKRLKIVADDKIPFLKGVLDSYADVVYLPGAKITAADVNDADAIFTRTRTKCNEALLKDSIVKLIATATIGFDHIDTGYCDAADIRWVNAPGCNSWSVQQYITAAIVTLVKERSLKLSDLTLGVIGVGNVGSKVAWTAEMLGMRVLRNDPPRAERETGATLTAPGENSAPERVTLANEGETAFIALDKLLTESDIVTCHTPLTKEGPYKTFHLASDDFFGKMKGGAVFVNTSRGPVTDTEALKRAVRTGRISEYILDVWEGEPNLDRDLLDGAFIGTPHIAGYSSDGKANGTAACIHEFCKFFNLNILPDWYPGNIPAPPVSMEIPLDGRNKSNEQVFYEAITHTYPVRDDSNRLKNAPETFEEQRGGYGVRREFKNFVIRAVNVGDDVVAALQGIGFRIA